MFIYSNFASCPCVVQMVPQSSVSGGGQQVASTVAAPAPQPRPPVTEQDLVDDQPLYVNAKQYHRILKRRQQRAKLEAQGKIPKERRVSSRGRGLLLLTHANQLLTPTAFSWHML